MEVFLHWKRIQIPESEKLFLVESGTRESLLLESGILGFGIRIIQLNDSGISIANDWNPEPKYREKKKKSESTFIFVLTILMK